jgi:hypothetical protein
MPETQLHVPILGVVSILMYHLILATLQYIYQCPILSMRLGETE